MDSPERDSAVRVTNVSKAYKIYRKPSDLLLEILLGRERHTKYWALKDISFDIKRGEVVGFLGPNGSGKSTLLRIIADKLDRTSGDVILNGRVSALFELGTGFNPEMTGRENIFHHGVYRGLSQAEIEQKYQETVEFSELAPFIDQPLKTYSAGMKARLAFSAAITVDPEILLIDEVLGVGDDAFQAKCSERIREICDSGATVLLVTHAAGYVTRLCDRAFYIEAGNIVSEGPALDIARVYQERMLARDAQRIKQEHAARISAQRPRDRARIQAHTSMEAAVLAAAGTEVDDAPEADTWFENLAIDSPEMPQPDLIVVGRPVTLSFDVVSKVTIPNVTIGCLIVRSTDGVAISSVLNSRALGKSYKNENRPMDLGEGRNRVSIHFPVFNIAAGTYKLTLSVSVMNRSTWGYRELALAKDVGAFSVMTYGEPNATLACELETDWRLNGVTAGHEPPIRGLEPESARRSDRATGAKSEA